MVGQGSGSRGKDGTEAGTLKVNSLCGARGCKGNMIGRRGNYRGSSGVHVARKAVGDQSIGKL